MTPPQRGEIPDVHAIDRQWLRDVLGWEVGSTEPITVASLSYSAGAMGAVYEVQSGAKAFVFKASPELDELDGLVQTTRLLEREIRCYRLLEAHRAAGTQVAPTCFWSVLREDGRGALALERVGQPRRLESVMARGLDRDAAMAAVETIATAHSFTAATSGSALVGRHPWLFTAVSEHLSKWIKLGIEELPAIAGKTWPGLIADDDLARVGELDLRRAMRASHAGARCFALCHGDAWAGNILFQRVAPAAHVKALLADWQFAMWGNPLSDLALLMLSSLATRSRLTWQGELLEQYHRTLIGNSKLDYPLEACRADFNRAIPFAAAVALASVGAYIADMAPDQLTGLADRVVACVHSLLAS